MPLYKLSQTGCFAFLRFPMVPEQTGAEHSTRGESVLSIEAVFDEEEGALLGFAIALTGRRETAEEIVQEAFLRLHARFAEIEIPRAWLYRCVRNLAYNLRRDTSREVQDGDAPEPLSLDPTPAENLSRAEVVSRLRESLAALPPRDRELVALKYEAHLGYKEIAARTGIGIGNVGFRLHHILKSLAASLRASGVESADG